MIVFFEEPDYNLSLDEIMQHICNGDCLIPKAAYQPIFLEKIYLLVYVKEWLLICNNN